MPLSLGDVIGYVESLFGSEPGEIVQIDDQGRLPAVDGSQLTNISSGQTQLSFGNATLDAITDKLIGYYDFTESGQNYKNTAFPPRMSDMSSSGADASSVSNGPDGNGVRAAGGVSHHLEALEVQLPTGDRAEWSANCWISVDDATPAGFHALLAYSLVTSANTGCGVFLSSGDQATVFRNSSFIATDPSSSFTDATMVMVTLVKRDNSGTPTIYLYIDGAEVASSSSQNTTTREHSIQLNRFGTNNQGAAAEFSALSVWAHGLTGAEVSALYNSGSGRFPS